ncbi:hypothetical protein N7456_001050 [Penicillium angulare]|uniref:Uncharacterized protein n=1 Tax=Penicillium angulare TaxID=116970 RepID=A0A9W9KRH7_9EURO|nr:hypothetical protein N7456_001050 [Penicillium angulare]
MIQDTLDQVFRFSRAIRRSGVLHRFVKFTNFIEYGENGENLTERFRTGATQLVEHYLKNARASRELKTRLIDTICLRQQNFAYLKARKPKQPIESASSRHPTIQRSTVGTNYSGSFFLSRNSATRNTQRKKMPNAGRSTMTATTAQARHVSVQHSVRDSAGEEAWENLDSDSDLPRPPVIPQQHKEFECPYCLLVCPSRDFKGKNWIKHIVADIMPYICVLESCPTPHVLFKSLKDWKTHMTNDHRIGGWTCIDPSHDMQVTFETEADFRSHLLQSHAGSVDGAALDELSSDCFDERAIGFSLDSCPFCPEDSYVEIQSGQISQHISQHLRSFSRISLVGYQDENGEDEEHDSGNWTDNASAPGQTSSKLSFTSMMEGLEDVFYQDPGDDQESLAILGGIGIPPDAGESTWIDYWDHTQKARSRSPEDPILQSLLASRKLSIRAEYNSPDAELRSPAPLPSQIPPSPFNHFSPMSHSPSASPKLEQECSELQDASASERLLHEEPVSVGKSYLPLWVDRQIPDSVGEGLKSSSFETESQLKPESRSEHYEPVSPGDDSLEDMMAALHDSWTKAGISSANVTYDYLKAGVSSTAATCASSPGNTGNSPPCDSAEISQQFERLELTHRTQLEEALASNDPNHPFAISNDPVISTRNRYINVQPYSRCRIHLPVSGGECDYINASPITLKDSATYVERKYIATQGPIIGEVYHFWQMVFHESKEVAVIVMLTSLEEAGRQNCCQYFPPDLNQPVMNFTVYGETVLSEDENFVVIGSVKLLSTSFDAQSRSEVRELKLTFGHHSKTVWHFYFAGWADYVKPEGDNRPALLELIALVRSRRQLDSPPIVHCSAGVGRTGVFIALDYLLHELDSGQLLYNTNAEEDPVYDCVMKMREQRMMMVQNATQMEFIYDILREQIDEIKIEQTSGQHEGESQGIDVNPRSAKMPKLDFDEQSNSNS